MIQFFIPGNPKALKRHRTFRRGKFNVNVDPSANDKADFLSMAMLNKPLDPIKEAISLYLEFRFARPKNHYNSKGKLKDSAPEYHTARPDFDNLEKFVADALNGVFWRDDSLICRSTTVKRYGDIPGVFIVIDDADVDYFGLINRNPV